MLFVAIIWKAFADGRYVLAAFTQNEIGLLLEGREDATVAPQGAIGMGYRRYCHLSGEGRMLVRRLG